MASKQRTGRGSEVVVVGAGLAGLVAANHVARRGHRVTVLERHSAPGGRAVTDVRGGVSFNRGPHGLYVDGEAARGLAELGVELAGRRAPRLSGALLGGTLHRAPAGAVSLLATRAFDAADKREFLRAFRAIGRVDAVDVASRSTTELVEHYTSRDRPRRMLEGLVRLSAYANLHDEMSADVAVHQLQLATNGGVRYLHGGWQRLVQQLTSHPGITLVGGALCDTLPDAAAVILASGGPEHAGRLLGRTFTVGPPSLVSVVDLGLSAPPRHDLVIGADVAFYLSNHSAALAPPGRWSVSAVQYLGAHDEPDADLLDGWIADAGVDTATVVERRRLLRMVASTAIPSARLGGLRNRPGVGDSGVDGVFLAGDWIGPVGHLADAAVASARQAAVAAVDHVERRAVA